MLWRNMMRAGTAALALGLCLTAPRAAAGQQPPAPGSGPRTLSLDDAIALAKQHSPDYLVAQNNESDADWAVKEAYGQVLPSASVGTSFQYQAAGTPQFGVYSGQDLGLSRTPSYYYSSWGLNLGYTLSGSKLYAPAAQRASRRAAVAQTDAAGMQLETGVAMQYMVVLQSQDAVALAKEQLASATENARLAEARVKVGSAIPLDAKQAQVEQGRAQVAVLQAANQLAAAKLQLSQDIGVELPQDVQLTTTFRVFTPPWTEPELIQRALRQQPQLRAAVAQADAARTQVKAARTQYLPSLAVNLGFSGSAREAGNTNYLIQSAQNSLAAGVQQCQLINEVATRLTSPIPGYPVDCGSSVLTDAQKQAILDQNNAFPFRFTRQPWYAQLSIQLPIFNGLTRARQLEGARLAARTAELRTRQQELAVRTSVSTAYASLVTAQKAYEIEVVNKEAAAEQLVLAQERYRVGSSSFVDLQAAQTTKAQADKSYLDALYGFDTAFAQLEAAVGTKLEPPTEGK